MARQTGTETMAVMDRPAELDETVTNGTDGGQDAQQVVADAVKRQRRNPDDLPDNEVVSVNIRFPNALRKRLAETAVEQQTSIPQLIVSMVAEAYGFELPKTTRAPRIKKYASKEDRIAAQKAKQQRDRQVSRAILQAIEEGKLDVDIETLLSDLRTKAQTEDAAAS